MYKFTSNIKKMFRYSECFIAVTFLDHQYIGMYINLQPNITVLRFSKIQIFGKIMHYYILNYFALLKKFLSYLYAQNQKIFKYILLINAIIFIRSSPLKNYKIFIF
ncbi:hypothetical protein EDEG_01445 [Edhazardia aedis USNM 41457]|uniref:Transmembrane protein n=1 Tax=Edhazardia aedis (strain USNM 41457) TaxID=1003232 RepID=J9D9V3_EDHAE|nr:hypothetical protein EDEG_01445 [Edhazardia aedis USNM 41457]|eukprot:EJW04289.1 hypothetical protein EDEG_01445 [Edhazardia aedis USNM 41457]